MHRTLIVLVPALMLSGCSLLRGNGPSREHSAELTGFDRGAAEKSSVPGVTPEMATRYGCTWQQVQTNWSRRRMAAARAGDPLCSVLGRYGQPFSVSLRRASDMQLLSLQYRPNGRYVNVVAVQYDDTPVNRRLQRQVGGWRVQSYGGR
jgi:hypothetical protein